MVRYFHENGIQVIGIVRREEQVEILKKEGAKFILNSENENYLTDLKNLCKEHNATVFFDAVAGETTGKVLTAMPNGSVCYVYGALAMKPSEITADQFIF